MLFNLKMYIYFFHKGYITDQQIMMYSVMELWIRTVQSPALQQRSQKNTNINP